MLCNARPVKRCSHAADDDVVYLQRIEPQQLLMQGCTNEPRNRQQVLHAG